MQDYPFLRNYPIGHALPYPNSYYYAPIMFIDPSMHLLGPSFNPYFANNTPLSIQRTTGKEGEGKG